MNENTQIALENGFSSAFIEGNKETPYGELEPRFLRNDQKNGIKVLNTIEDELTHCSEFFISVAFITHSGIEPLLMTLAELEKKNIPGKVLTTDYKSFSEPKALRRLAQFKNIEVKLYCCEHMQNPGFHTKGYIFRNTDLIHIILGSSNWTATALTTNQEWNARLVSNEEGRFASELLDEFKKLWKEPESLPLEKVIDFYEEQWCNTKKIREQESAVVNAATFTPNTMQQEFVKRVCDMYDAGERRALLISATGTGKTFAAAFAIKKIKPKRLLFLVHREQIAKQAMASFKLVLKGQYKSYGLLSGNKKDFDADCLFATMQSMSKSETLKQYDPSAFDFIVIDEVHRAGAKSYENIMSHFDPKFWLGMTASPDRPDGYNIYGLFHHNIAYEIRLETALAENLLCPFHYFGITDLNVNDKVMDALQTFNQLTSEQRVRHIIEKSKFFGYSGKRVKGLVFCSRLDECEKLSEKFNARGYQTIALSGSDSPEKREAAVARLTQETRDENALDYIFTVDIFNEGVDIPEINQVILLRATQSSIIFIQQLGRGLRKAKDKNFVVVLDFIGNYQNNYLIPIALSGDNSYNKDTLRKFVTVGHKLIPGASTVRFDEITRQRIYRAIDSAKTMTTQILTSAYKTLKFKLGRRPTLIDFELHNSIDVTKIFEKFGSYYTFLKKYDSEFKAQISAEAEEMLCFYSKQLGKAQRISEVLILEALLSGTNQNSLKQYLRNTLSKQYRRKVSEEHLSNVEKVLTNNFVITEGIKKSRTNCVFIESDGNGEWKVSNRFKQVIQKNPALRVFLEELLVFMKNRFHSLYRDSYKGTDFVLNKKYTYEDVCRLLNWEKNVNGQNIGGYKYDEGTKTLPVFINYHKDANALAYNDRFVSSQEIIALSKSNRRANSKDADHIYKRTPVDKGNRIYLFIRRDKNDNDGAKSFYFLGEIEAQGEPTSINLDSGQPAFEISYKLANPVRQEIYDYITAEIPS